MPDTPSHTDPGAPTVPLKPSGSVHSAAVTHRHTPPKLGSQHTIGAVLVVVEVDVVVVVVAAVASRTARIQRTCALPIVLTEPLLNQT